MYSLSKKKGVSNMAQKTLKKRHLPRRKVEAKLKRTQISLRFCVWLSERMHIEKRLKAAPLIKTTDENETETEQT